MELTRNELDCFRRYKEIIDPWDDFVESLHRRIQSCLWVNTLKTSVQELQEQLQREGIFCRPVSWCEQAFHWESDHVRMGKTMALHAGLYHLQEEVSMISGYVLDVQPGEDVLDLCAAPGSKTAQFGVAMQNRGTLIANDRNYGRLRALRRVLERMGIMNVSVTVEDGSNFPHEFLFDRVMVDVPCSCEGTTRKNPAIFKRLRKMHWDALGGVQQALLRKAIHLCKSGGRIVYSTCTYAPEENECVVDAVLRTFPSGSLRVVPLTISGLQRSPGLTRWQKRRFIPILKDTA
ncbi:MAG: RsmB/NOP family class I SAM-dependent RNA methyltransferase, partial [Myxococcota bacterium]